ncbi:MAG: hypothetical protein V7K38_02775 [Nostoc sp.]
MSFAQSVKAPKFPREKMSAYKEHHYQEYLSALIDRSSHNSNNYSVNELQAKLQMFC